MVLLWGNGVQLSSRSCLNRGGFPPAGTPRALPALLDSMPFLVVEASGAAGFVSLLLCMYIGSSSRFCFSVLLSSLLRQSDTRR